MQAEAFFCVYAVAGIIVRFIQQYHLFVVVSPLLMLVHSPFVK